jgi:hypothetical protein
MNQIISHVNYAPGFRWRQIDKTAFIVEEVNAKTSGTRAGYSAGIWP